MKIVAGDKNLSVLVQVTEVINLKYKRLDWESIRSSPRDGSSIGYQWGEWLGGWVWWVGWLTPKIFVSAPGLLKMVHQVRFMTFSLKMVDYSMSFLSLCTSNFTDK